MRRQRSAEKTPARYAVDILVRPNLMTWTSAVHCTQDDPGTVMVRCAAPWLGWTCLLGSVLKEFMRRSSAEPTWWLRPSQHGWRLVEPRAQGAFRTCNSARHTSLKAGSGSIAWLFISSRTSGNVCSVRNTSRQLLGRLPRHSRPRPSTTKHAFDLSWRRR
jgi:hypothetical protein